MKDVPFADVLVEKGYRVSNFLLREEDIRTTIEWVALVIRQMVLCSLVDKD
jgi:hypothetical protein